MAEAGKSGLLDLEKELTCAICTDILYQPLTLLDCLHIFCGSCLKDWFEFQASRSSGCSNPYTCPSCRALVRGTRPDAKITTLLEMYLQVNPDKAKSIQEKEDMASKYKPGDNVIPVVHINTEDVDEDDRRMVEEARALSLREQDERLRGYERGTRHRQRTRDNRHNAPSPSDSRAQARQIEHQSSLRSLISNSDIDSREMEDEIMRQITEEGLLDGIDLQNLDDVEQDQLTERIAEAYRRRHGQRARSQDTRPRSRESSRHRQQAPAPAPSAQQPSSRRHARSASTADQASAPSHPPISRPHLLEAYPASQGQGHGHRRRTSSESRRQTSPIPGSSATRHEAARSATDLSQRPRMPEARDRRPSDVQTRRLTDPRPRRMSESGRSSSHPIISNQSAESRRRDSPRGTGSPLLSPTIMNHTSSPTLPQSPPTTFDHVPRSYPFGSPRRAAATIAVQDAERSRPPSSSSASSRTRSILYPEPSIACNACGKANIQYDLHANCEICKDGRWNLCHRCYRLSKGCEHYFGFGRAALHRFQQRANAGQELPHTLVGAQYDRPSPESMKSSSSSTPGSKMTTENPANRLRFGAFCYICHAYANDYFWHCSTCNDGEWGYCTPCVSTGRVCTHPLLPLAHVSAPRNKPSSSDPGSDPPHSISTFAPLFSPSQFPASNIRASGRFRPLAISVNCSICTYPIPPNQSRYHCYICDSGDHDICSSCYKQLCSAGHISKENGEYGWRRCLRGHRMVVVAYEDAPSGQRRLITRDLVGGHFLSDADANDSGGPEEVGVGTYRWLDGDERRVKTLSGRLVPRTGDPPGYGGNRERKFPPDGGVGMRTVALYTWLPAEGVKDELAFPRGAEITEALEISEEWYQGRYAGSKGLFPRNYTKVLGVVSM